MFEACSFARSDFSFRLRTKVYDGCVFRKCLFKGAPSFRNVEFHSCFFENCVFGDSSPVYLWPKTTFRNCAFVGGEYHIEGVKPSFVDCVFTDIKISRAYFKNSNFENMEMTGEISGAVIVECRIDNVNLSGCLMDDSIFQDCEIKFLHLPKSSDHVWADDGVLYLREILQEFEKDIVDIEKHIEYGIRTGGVRPGQIFLYDAKSIQQELDLSSLDTALQIVRKIREVGPTYD